MKIIFRPLSILAILTLTGAATLNAQTLLNGDFSSPDVGTGYEQTPPTNFMGESGTSDPSGDITGPETFGFNGNGGVISTTFLGSTFSSSPTSQLVFFRPDNNFSASPEASGNPDITGLYQDLGALQANMKYTVQIYESTGSTSSYGNGGATFQLALYNGTDDSTTPIATTTDSFAAPGADAVFTLETVSFTTGATVSGHLTFGVSSYDDLSEGSGQDFVADATLMATPVLPLTPEPSTWALMLLGLGGLAFGLRRRAVRNS
jgi:PEP-CTERM motif